MDDLTVARETNRRLNRRLGDMEHQLHSLVSVAQNETSKAQKIAGQAQEVARRANAEWHKQYKRASDSDRTIDRLAMWLFAIGVWAVAATAAAVWFGLR